MKKNQVYFNKIKAVIDTLEVSDADLEYCEHETRTFFDELKAIDTELDLKIALYKFTDLIWLIDDKTKESKKSNYDPVLKLREILSHAYDRFINAKSLILFDINKHYLFDKSVFYQLIEREKDNDFETLKKPVYLHEFSNIPERRDDFVGRKEKAENIIQEITRDNNISLCISGEVFGDNGGVGKTTLAVEVAYFLSDKSLDSNYQNPLKIHNEFNIYKNYFEDGVLWINISSTERNIHDVISNIATQIGYSYYPIQEVDSIENNQKEQKESTTTQGIKEKATSAIESTFYSENEKLNKPTSEELDRNQEESLELNLEKESFKDVKDLKIVRSLEEIALILNNKKILIVIDNAEQNKLIFEYIFPRLNGFASIIITSRYRIPGINHILIGNLDKKDARILFLNSLEEGNLLKQLNEGNQGLIDALCSQLLEGHPMSINLAAKSKVIKNKGLEQFTAELDDAISSIKHNRTYKKVYGLVRVGEILNKTEREVLIRGASVFQGTFSLEEVYGFCISEDVAVGLEGLYRKSILRPLDKEQKYVILQVFKDFALDELEKECMVILRNFFKVDCESNEDMRAFLSEQLVNVNLLDAKIKSLEDRFWIALSLISYMLVRNNSGEIYDEKNNFFIQYLFMLEYSKKYNKYTRVIQAYQKISIFYKDKNYLNYLELEGLNFLHKDNEKLIKGGNYLYDFFLDKDYHHINAVYGTLALTINRIGSSYSLDYILNRFTTDFVSSYHDIFDCYIYSAYINEIPTASVAKYLELFSEIILEKLPLDSQPLVYQLLKAIKYRCSLDNIRIQYFPIEENIVSIGESLSIPYEEDLIFFNLIEKFHAGEFSGILSVDEREFTDGFVRLQLNVMKYIMLHRFDRNIESSYIGKALAIKYSNNLSDILTLINTIRLYVSDKEFVELIDYMGLKNIAENHLNVLTQQYERTESLLYIPQGRVFIQDKTMLLLDDSFVLNNIRGIFDQKYTNFINEKDMGVILYPYLISSVPVSLIEYKRFCHATNKPFDENSIFSIFDAIEYATAKGMRLATEEEWMKAFTDVNYNISIPQSLNLSLYNNSEKLIDYHSYKDISTCENSNNLDQILNFILPPDIIKDLPGMTMYNIEQSIERVFTKELMVKDASKPSNLFEMPLPLVKLIAYSPSINTPKLKQLLIGKIEKQELDNFEMIYKLLLKDILFSYVSNENKDNLLLELISQGNIWKVALKFIFGLESYYESLKFTDEIEMVQGRENGKDVAIYKMASNKTVKLKMQHKKGFVPFRCVKQLPIEFGLFHEN